MAQVHNVIRKFTRLLAAYRQLMGEESSATWGVERLGETLTPTLDLYARPDFAALAGEALWWDTVTSPIVAGQLSFVVLVVPLNLPIICTLEGWWSSAPQNTFVGSHPTAAAIAAATAIPDARDRRFGSSQTITALRVGAGAEAVTTQTRSLGAQPANTATAASCLMTVPAIINPGNNVSWQHDTLATALTINMYGRVRRAFPGELGTRVV